MNFRKVTHVLFDNDGVVVDSEELYSQAFQNVLDEYGKKFCWDLKVTLLGLKSHELADKVIKYYDLPMTVEEFQRRSREQYKTLFPDVALRPGVQRLINHLHQQGVPIALATSSSRESTELKMSKHRDVFDLFHHMVMGSSDPEIKRGKPSPDIFLVCAQRFPDPPKPENCLVIEDAVNGVAAALAAGMQVVMVPDERLDKELTKEATLVLDSLELFKPELFGLPPFQD